MVAFFLVMQAVILFGAARRLDWIWAWVFIGIGLAVVLVNGTFMLRFHPETVAERARLTETKDWDKAIEGLLALAQYVLVPLVAGLDQRFQWTGQLSAGWNVAGGVVLSAGYGLTAWAMITNAYFSTAVRIQSERGHAVCSSGPYCLVRHPGYVGFILQCLGTPVLLGSLWALLPGIAAIGLLTIRTSLEDRTLQAELPGYAGYMQRVRYRLFPGLW
jgi:protein-S-isoprenylcysteine O-methyltransferase Ste14